MNKSCTIRLCKVAKRFNCNYIVCSKLARSHFKDVVVSKKMSSKSKGVGNFTEYTLPLVTKVLIAVKFIDPSRVGYVKKIYSFKK
jgi:hypothetical protein